MKKTLDELCGIQGVNGAFLASEEGELLAYSAPPIYDDEILSQAATTLARATDSMSIQHSDWDTFVAHFEDEKLFVSKMDNYLLCAIADSSLKLPFLNVALRVAKKKLLKRLNGNASSMGASAPTISGYSSQFSAAYSSQPTAVQGPAHNPMVPHADAHTSVIGSGFPDSSSMLWSGMGGTGMQSSAVSVADEAASKTLTKISEALATIVGPMAKVFVKEAVRAICQTEPFSVNAKQRLISELETRHLSDPDDLQDFRNEMR